MEWWNFRKLHIVAFSRAKGVMMTNNLQSANRMYVDKAFVETTGLVRHFNDSKRQSLAIPRASVMALQSTPNSAIDDPEKAWRKHPEGLDEITRQGL